MRELLYLIDKYHFSQILLAVGLMLSRILGMVWLVPFLGGKLVPGQIKMGLSFVIALFLYPYVLSPENMEALFSPQASPFPLAVRMVGLFSKEVFVGFVLGFIISTVWHGAEMIGRFVDTARGSAMGSALVPQMKSQASVFGSLYYQLLLVVFLLVDGHLFFLNFFIRSYILIPMVGVPPLTSPGIWGFFEMIMRLTSHLFVMSLILSMPILIAIFITDICMGLFNKVAPQINVLFLMMPFKAALGILFAVLSLYLFVEESQKLMVQALKRVWLAIRYLAS